MNNRRRGPPVSPPELLRRTDIVAVDVVVQDALLGYLRTHARNGRWVVTHGEQGPNRGGRPRGSGRYSSRRDALRDLRRAYSEVDGLLDGEREVLMSDLARKLGVGRSSVYWWFDRWHISMADLA